MNMLFTNKYYITRTGDFATDANKKLGYTMLGVCLCYHDYIERGTLEYASIFMGASLFWTAIELFLNMTKSRLIKPMVLQVRRRVRIPVNKYIGIALQGTQEGGVVTVIGLYFGDRSRSIHYQTIYHIIILYMMLNMTCKKSNLKTRSRRQINTCSSLSIMGTVTLYNAATLYYNQRHLYRILNMFLSMIYISSIWTYVSYKKMFRNVETESFHTETNDYELDTSTNKTVFNVLAYDVIFEIGLAYITFYNLFIVHFPFFM